MDAFIQRNSFVKILQRFIYNCKMIIIYLTLHSMYICVDTYNINLRSENERNISSK